MKKLKIYYAQFCCKVGAKLERAGKRLFAYGLRANRILASNWKEIDDLFNHIKKMQEEGLNMNISLEKTNERK